MTGCSPSTQGKVDEEKDSNFIAGKNRLNNLDYQGAIESFEKALESNPHSASAHFELGLVCYQNVGDYAGAIYHFRKFLKLRPSAPHAENINQFVNVCKQELAKGVPLAPITRRMQQDLETLASENLLLRQERDFLSKSLKEATNRLASIPPALSPVSDRLSEVPSNPAVTSRFSPKTPLSTTSTTASVRRHVVRPRETVSSIARQYRITPSRLLAANPGVIPKRLRPGQTLNIPFS